MPFHIVTQGLASGGTLTGDLIITGTLNVQGNVTFDVLQTTTGIFTAEDGIIIDVTKTEALLVRQNADAADIFIVDTTNSTVKLPALAGGAGAIVHEDPAAPGTLKSNSLFVIASTNRMGIGIAPQRNLHIHASGGGTVPTIAMRLSNNSPAQGRGTGLEWFNDVEQGRIVCGQQDSTDNDNAFMRFFNRQEDAQVEFMQATGKGLRIGATEGSDLLDEIFPEKLAIVGNADVVDPSSLASESITDGAFPDSTNWAGATDWSDTISGNTTYTHSSGSGTLTQALADLAIAGKNNRWYKLTYTVSAITNVGANVLTLTNAFAAATVTLDISTAATFSVVFQSNSSASAADFVLSATSDTASDTFTLDDVILKEIIGGDMIVAGSLTGGGANGLSIDGDGITTFDTAIVVPLGSAIDPSITFSDGIGWYNLGASRIGLATAGGGTGFGVTVTAACIQTANAYFGFVIDGTSCFTGAADVRMYRGGVGIMAFTRKLTGSPMSLQINNEYTSATNGDDAEIGFLAQANVLTIETKQKSSGTAVPMSFRTNELSAMQITTSQQVQIGPNDTAQGDEVPPEKLTVLAGNFEVFDEGTLGAETLTDGAFPDSTNWAGTTDWSDTISGTTTYTHSAGSGALTQTAAQRVTGNEGSNARWYELTYDVSAVTNVGANVLTITSAFAAAAVTLNIATNGTGRKVVFQSHATTADTADFVLSATSDTASDTFTLDNLILKEIIGGNIILGGKLTGGGSDGLQVSGGGTVSTFEKDLGTVGATETIDWRDGNHQKLTLDENLTITFIDPDGPASLVVHFVQDGSGTNTVAWPSNVDWEGGTAPTITAASSSIDIVTLYFDGTRYFGGFLQNFS